MRPLWAAGGMAEVLWDGEGWTPHGGQGSIREVSIRRSRCQEPRPRDPAANADVVMRLSPSAGKQPKDPSCGEGRLCARP